MKKLIVVLLAVAVLLSLTACGKKNTKPAQTENAATLPQKTTEAAEKETEEKKEYVKFDVRYEIRLDGTAEVVGYSGEGNQIYISSSYEGHDVVRIADSAFEDCTMLEDVIMMADIEEIGDAAFKGCAGLENFSIPSETVRIGDRAFEGCTKLKDLYIWGDPDIGEYAFANCTALKSIDVGSDTKTVGEHAFEGCTGATSLYIWGGEIIGDYAFAGCTGIKSVSIPDEVLSIGNHAFDGCSALSSVFIWGDDTAIGEDAFANCPMLSNPPAARGTVLESRTTNKDNNTETDVEPKAPTSAEVASGIRPEFKEAMDSYEAFMDEYCEFMKKYKENQTDITLLQEYPTILRKYNEVTEAFAAWSEKEMTKEELAYYLEVTNRVSQKLLEVT